MPDSNDADFSIKKIEERISSALRAWHTPADGANDLLGALLIIQKAKENISLTNSTSAQRLAENQVLMTCIEELESQDPQMGRVIRLRFVDKKKLWAVANMMAISDQSVSRLQRKGIQQLAQIISHRESAARKLHAQQMEAALPPATYTKLFGTQGISRKLLDLLTDGDGPAVVAVVGLGGIGKTALTDAIVRRIIDQFCFYKVIWLRIGAQTLSGRLDNPELTIEHLITELIAKIWPGNTENLPPEKRILQLRQELQRLPYLVVIDNLESQTNATYVLNQLHQFTHPTRFLLTSRSRLTELASVFNVILQELSLTDSIALVRYYAQECGIQAVSQATDQDIAQIYNVTGGNPLALKLVVSLLNVLPLPEILAELTTTHTKSIEGMYRHIYQQSWMTLSDNGRILLQSMPLVSEMGGTLPYLATVSGLTKEEVRPALHELHNRSLIEVRGTIHEKRYGIHRLTNSFLCNEIINLPE